MNQRIGSPEEVREYLRKYSGKRQEHFFVITLDGAHQVIKKRVVTIGITNRTIVHPREVFWNAIKDNAVAIIVAHNHPSGNLEPSPDDIEITNRLKEAGEILGIHVMDHVVFSKSGYVSFAEKGMMEGHDE